MCINKIIKIINKITEKGANITNIRYLFFIVGKTLKRHTNPTATRRMLESTTT